MALHFAVTRFILYLLIFSSVAFAQPTSAQLTGTIADASGAAVPGAALSITNVDTQQTREAASNELGYYTIPLLPPGAYRVQVQKQGFRPIARSGVVLSVNQTARIDFTLELGSVTEAINVTASTPLVETSNGMVGQVIDNRKVTQLPLSGRNVYNLAALSPGASVDNTGRTRINGARARSNEYLVDGVTQVSPETRGDPLTPPPVDSVQEFKVLTSNYSAEYGNASGGVINVATRSGTNRLQGTLWEFLRNDKLNTRNFFAPAGQPKPVLRQNQFGAAGGGPVYVPKLYDGRNRTFFFADFEGLRVRQQRVFNVTVPTAAMRAGDLSQFLGTQTFTDAQGRSALQGQIFDPATTRTVNGVVTRDPFPGNVVPPSRIDPIAAKLLGYYPNATSNALTQNFQRATSTGNNADRWDVRGDHDLSSRHHVFGRYSDVTTDSLPTVPFRGATGDIDTQVGKQRSVTTAWTSTLSPSRLNEFRFAWLLNRTDKQPYLAGQNLASTLGIGGITTEAGLPNIDISDIQSIGSNFSGSYLQGQQQVYSFIDHLSWITGRHSIKFGAEVRLYRLRNFQPSLLNGNFAFRALQTGLPGTLQSRTGNAFASFLLGQVQQSQYTQKDPGQIVSNETYAGFIQDDFKITRRLTVNLGLRYELNTRIADTRGFSSTFDLTAGRVLAGEARPDVSLDRNNFAPRIGFALDVAGNQTFVVRGGYGIFHQPIQGAGGNPLAGVVKFPYEFTANAVSPNDLDPVTTLSRGPVLQPAYDPTDPRLGSGGDVLVQNSNLAPYAQQWNLSVERALWRNAVLSVGYVGSGGRKLDTGRNGYINLNQVPIERVRQAAREQNTTNPNTAGLRPYPNFNQVQQLLPRYGNSNYNSLQVRGEQTYRAGLSLLLAYTWSKSIDNGSEVFGFTGGSWPQDIYNLRAERAVSTADVPHRFVGSLVWDLPFGAGRTLPLRGVWNAVAGGWQVSSIATLSSGRPVDVEQSTNTTRTFNLLQRPNVSGNPILPAGERTLDRYFDTSKFSAADPLSFGTSPRNPIRGPGLVNLDAALLKSFPFQEQRAVEFRFETFNLTNTPPFLLDTRVTYNPNLPLSSQTFGRITSAGNGRLIQLALKLRF